MLTSHELFGFMSPALADEILAYAHESDKPLYRTTLHAVAAARKVRPVFLERQPRPQRHAAMLTMLCRPGLELAAGNLVVRDNRLRAVIDWGSLATGDPACDLMVALPSLKGGGTAQGMRIGTATQFTALRRKLAAAGVTREFFLQWRASTAG